MSKAAKKFFSLDANVDLPAQIQECPGCGRIHRCNYGEKPEVRTQEPVYALNERHAVRVFKREHRKAYPGERISVVAVREATPEEIEEWRSGPGEPWGTPSEEDWDWPG